MNFGKTFARLGMDVLKKHCCLESAVCVYTESDDVGKAQERGYKTVGDFR